MQPKSRTQEKDSFYDDKKKYDAPASRDEERFVKTNYCNN
jgi:hypothetical protein